MVLFVLVFCCVVAAVLAWLVIPNSKKSANDGSLVVPAIFQAPQTIEDNRFTLGPEAAKMAEKLVVLQQFADQKQKEKQVETVVKEFQELLK
jgi:hypothetical protein